MKYKLGVFLLGGVAGCALVMSQSLSELPLNPHAFMDQPDICSTCHKYWEGQLEPHMFSVMVHEVCEVCHAELGRSHPININPQDYDIQVDETIPLAYIEQLGDDVVSCGSCHNPHGEWFSPVKAYEKQPELFLLIVSPDEEIKYYKTYYLRASDPVKGYLVLCVLCHPYE